MTTVFVNELVKQSIYCFFKYLIVNAITFG